MKPVLWVFFGAGLFLNFANADVIATCKSPDASINVQSKITIGQELGSILFVDGEEIPAVRGCLFDRAVWRCPHQVPGDDNIRYEVYPRMNFVGDNITHVTVLSSSSTEFFPPVLLTKCSN